jgi:hypothetical protein
MAVALMTKLDAINAMLESVWEAPISTLDVSGVASVAMAKRVLDKTLINILARGWAFNTEDELTLTPDTSQNINLGVNVIECDTTGVDKDIDVVMRGLRLYNRADHTFAFAAPIKVRQILLLDFEDLPQSARTYIALQAARVFRDKWNQNDTSSGISPEEAEALRNVEESEGQQQDNNVFTDSYSVANILCR